MITEVSAKLHANQAKRKQFRGSRPVNHAATCVLQEVIIKQVKTCSSSVLYKLISPSVVVKRRTRERRRLHGSRSIVCIDCYRIEDVIARLLDGLTDTARTTA